jgi:hypothetical protein
MKDDNNLNRVQEPITNAPTEVKEIMERVLRVEKDKFYLRSPKNINEDILMIIKEVIQ